MFFNIFDMTSINLTRQRCSSSLGLKINHWLRITIFIVLVAAIVIDQANSQMTFSDGWGKRSVMFKEMRRLAPSTEDTKIGIIT